MRFVAKQRWFTMANHTNVRDEQGKEVYAVDGNFRGIGPRLWIYDMQRKEVARVETKPVAFNPDYEVYREGKLRAVVHQDFPSIFSPTFKIEIVDGGSVSVQGTFPGYEYTLARDDRPIARVTEKWPKWPDTIGIAVADGEDQPLLLACIAIIDYCANYR